MSASAALPGTDPKAFESTDPRAKTLAIEPRGLRGQQNEDGSVSLRKSMEQVLTTAL
jgi:hypothetical protein